MSKEEEVEFLEENGPDSMQPLNKKNKPKGALSSWLVKIGLADNQSTANKIMIAVIFICFLAMLFIIF